MKLKSTCFYMDKIHHDKYDISLSSLKVDSNCIKKSISLKRFWIETRKFLDDPEPDDKTVRMLKKVKSV